MPATIVDARGQPCPQPVILARRALAHDREVTVIVDNTTARENVAGMARSQGHAVRIEERGSDILVHITAQGTPAPAPGPEPATPLRAGPLVVLFAADAMGRGAEELGGILVRGFLHALNEVEPRPDTLVFLNSGVRLVVEGSPVLEDLQALAAHGVQILACGTCLGYYGLKDKVAVGTVSNMYTIAETLLGAGKVVAL